MATTPSASIRQWLADLIGQHDGRIARRGEGYVGRVRGWRLDRSDGAVSCEVPGSGDEPYRVVLRPASESGRDAACSCPFGEDGRFLCKHTFAAAVRLAELLDAAATDEVEAVVGDAAADSAKSATEARPIQLLDAFLSGPDEKAPVAAEPVARLCWIVKPHRGGPFGAGLSIRPAAEVRSCEVWRRSGLLSWDRLAACPDLGTTPQDRAALAAVRRDDQRYGFDAGRKPLWTAEPHALVSALVGHPRVLLSGREEPLDVRLGTLGLAVVSREAGYELAPAVDGESIDGTPADGMPNLFPTSSGVIVLDRPRGRLSVAAAGPKVRGLVASLRPHEVVPFFESDALAERLARLESRLPVACPDELRRLE